ncbi:hypothetical protein NA57DRAFT_55258 [Rhizodiscina lignyota]|uniref:Heterokaryon incompatibility domain-containing protein n=1 Tax=Rhizodiscina lignyota TaxID=1504668 RepID=A0A9P4IHB1_9PEZI|nr:hypothetical protein NA57DRAFT_55258 [Rhizodiscina lignyota]
MPFFAQFASLTGGNMLPWEKKMQFDLHLPIEQGHNTRSGKQLQRQILKVLDCATPTDASARGTWRVFGGHRKGSLRFLTAYTRRVMSWSSDKAVHPRNFESRLDLANGTPAPQFQVVEADHLSGLHRDKPKYLAVSYRWPKRSRQKAPADLKSDVHCYDVWDPRANGGHGGVRKNNAPKEVIDRAIKFAKDRRIQLVWIDQECINQSDRHDKECGIRSMDDIFLNAAKVIGLLQVRIDSETEAKVLHRLTVEQPRLDPKSFKAAVNVVYRISQDEWFSRAWTFQEAISGGNTIEFSMKCDPKLKQQASHGDTDAWGAVEDEIQFQFVHIAKWLACLFAQAAFYDQNPSPDLLDGDRDDIWQKIEEIRISLMNHFPPFYEPTHLSRPRLSCNASAALMFLKKRQNSRAPDRVSILASLGNYPRKLNIMKIHKFTMSSCVLAQALHNGDISVLSSIEKDEWRKKKRSQGFSWLPPTTIALENVAAHHEGHPSLRLVDHSITKRGLSLPGFYWTVNQKIDVRSIKEKYFQEWGETRSAEGQEEIKWVLRKIEKDARTGTGEFFDRLVNASEKYCIRDLHNLDDDKALAHQAIGSQILGELLCLLVEKNYLNMANSIWHSVRRKTPILSPEEMENSHHTRHSDNSTLTEVPGSWFNKHHPLGELPCTLNHFVIDGRLQIPCISDRSRAGRLFIPMKDNWEWIIDRIMRDGFLWGGQSSDDVHSNIDDESTSCIFDVDCGCVVLTPYCGEEVEKMEDSGNLIAQSLPLMRSRRISWVVERAEMDHREDWCGLLSRRDRTDSDNLDKEQRSWLSRLASPESSRYRYTTKGMVAGIIEPTVCMAFCCTDSFQTDAFEISPEFKAGFAFDVSKEETQHAACYSVPSPRRHEDSPFFLNQNGKRKLDLQGRSPFFSDRNGMRM